MGALTEPSSVLQMPVDICGAVLEFADPRDWFLHARLSANHYESFTKHISRMLGVSEAQANAALHFFDEGQWSAVQSQFETWMDQREKRMILIPQERFPLLLGYPCIRESKRYTGRVRVKSLDESYWQDNYPDGGSDAIQWEIIGRGWENPIHLRNLKDLTEVEYAWEGEKSVIDQNTLSQQNDPEKCRVYSMDPVTHQLTLAGVIQGLVSRSVKFLPFDRDGHPQMIVKQGHVSYYALTRFKRGYSDGFRIHHASICHTISENRAQVLSVSDNWEVLSIDVKNRKKQYLIRCPIEPMKMSMNHNEENLAVELLVKP